MKIVKFPYNYGDVQSTPHKFLELRQGNAHNFLVLKSEVASWLEDNFGPGERFYQNEMDGDEHFRRIKQSNPQTWAYVLRGDRHSDNGHLEFWFLHNTHAALFKLTWGGS